MHRPDARLYVLEGVDGVGKTTIANRLVRTLRSSGTKCIYASFPGKRERTLGALVYDVHHRAHRFVDSLVPTSLQLLHVAAHIDALERDILPALRSGTSVVLDRWWWSTWAYGLATGVPRRVLVAMIRVERLAWGRCKPDAVFFLSRANIQGEASSPRDRERAAVLQRAYEDLRSREQRKYPVHVIHNDGAPETTVAALQQLVAGAQGPSELAATIDRHVHPPHEQRQLRFLRQAPAPAPLPTVFSRLAPAKPTAVFDTYWRFAAERQNVFFRRISGAPPPWTDDPIIRGHKFTNAYRASDRVSQYLIRNIIYRGAQTADEVFFRTILFKIFNKIETWESLQRALGEVRFSEFSFSRYDRVLSAAQERGESIYSAAYIMPTGGAAFPRGPKHRMHLRLLEMMMKDELPKRIFDAPSMRAVFEMLRAYPTIGDFLAYQYATDLNYSSLMDHRESDFVVPGPGARDGIQKCFSERGGLSEAELIKFVSEKQHEEFARLELTFQDLWGRPLQLIDCQNLFCEVDKYARVRHPDVKGRTGRTRIKQRFSPTPSRLHVWYPPKWELNDHVDAWLSSNTGNVNLRDVATLSRVPKACGP